MVEAGPFDSISEVIADLTAEWGLAAPFTIDGLVIDDLGDAVRAACYKSQQVGKATMIASEPGRTDLVTWFTFRYRRGSWRYIAQTVWREDLAA